MSIDETYLSTVQRLITDYLKCTHLDTELLAQLKKIMTASQRHTQTHWAAHMTPEVNELAALGQLMASLHQGNLLSPELYPELTMIENDIFDFFCPLFGQHYGHVTHGGSYGNLDALWQARKKFGDKSKRVYASDQAHYSIAKACDILGLDLQLIPSNSSQQMDIEALESACKKQAPMAVVATAGTTNSGQLDDIDAVTKLLMQHSGWLHVDAAWGGFLSLIENSVLNRQLLGQVDSVSFDPHKSLGQPRPCGLLLYQHPIKLTSSSTQYLSQTPRDILPGSYGAELLLPLWLTIKTLGKSGLVAQLQKKLDQAEAFSAFINDQIGWWAQKPATGIVCFTAAHPHDLSSLVERGIFSTTHLKDKSVYRSVFASHATRSDVLIKELAPYL